jgi:hypothetical protein
VSYATQKGYRAERAVELWLYAHGYATYPAARPYPRPSDFGDHQGLPLVLSTKDRRDLTLAKYVDELETIVERSPFGTGAVIHKRAGRGSPGQWYVTMSGRLWLPQLGAYIREHDTRSHPPGIGIVEPT